MKAPPRVVAIEVGEVCVGAGQAAPPGGVGYRDCAAATPFKTLDPHALG